jgi:hypothetical protein
MRRAWVPQIVQGPISPESPGPQRLARAGIDNRLEHPTVIRRCTCMRLTSSSYRIAAQKAKPGETINKAAKRLGLPEWVPAPRPTPARIAQVGNLTQNLKDLRGFWGKSISDVDRHARTCKPCWKPRIGHKLAVQTGALLDPKMERYKLCKTARKLESAERSARTSYLAAGGRLPTH